MSEFERAVADAMDPMAAEQPADDAQAAGITAEALMNSLLGESETAENEGDGGQAANVAQAENQQEQDKDDKISRRMRAALANQKRQLFSSLGGTEEEIRQIVREHRAAKLSRENPKISPEAAEMIVAEREKVQAIQPERRPDADAVAAVQSLIDEGWTREELSAFVQDEVALEQINVEGVSIRRAATDFLRRRINSNGTQSKTEPDRRRGVPTFRAATTAQAQGRNAIAEMSDEEFARFSERMEQEALTGRKIRL